MLSHSHALPYAAGGCLTSRLEGKLHSVMLCVSGTSLHLQSEVVQDRRQGQQICCNPEDTMTYDWLCSEAAAAGEDAVMDEDEAAAPSKREVWTA